MARKKEKEIWGVGAITQIQCIKNVLSFLIYCWCPIKPLKTRCRKVCKCIKKEICIIIMYISIQTLSTTTLSSLLLIFAEMVLHHDWSLHVINQIDLTWFGKVPPFYRKPHNHEVRGNCLQISETGLLQSTDLGRFSIILRWKIVMTGSLP